MNNQYLIVVLNISALACTVAALSLGRRYPILWPIGVPVWISQLAFVALPAVLKLIAAIKIHSS